MRNLCETELAVLRRYKLVKSMKISVEEYESILNTNPHYVYVGRTPDELYKYVVPDDISEETLEALERSEALKALYDNNHKLKTTNEELEQVKEQLNEKLGALQYMVRIIKNIMVWTFAAAVIFALISIWGLFH